ncbi:MAG: NAD-dependent epimerase/dehydratase family protein [Candidatus Thorarchaeota archaeon]
MKILVTGGTSGIGYFTIEELLKKYDGKEIFALYRSEKPHKDLIGFGIEFVKGDLLDQASLDKACKGVDVVYHIAGDARENLPSQMYYDANHIGTKNLLEAFVKNKCKKFIFVSSVGIYGYKLPPYPIKETHPKKGDNAYQTSKWLAEQEVFKYSKKHGFFATALRPNYILGPRDRQLAPNLFEYILKDKKIPLIKGGKATISLVHHKDLARALIMCGDEEKANGEAFNIVGATTTIKEVFEKIGDICGKKPNFMPINYQLAYTVGLLYEVVGKLTRKEPSITRRRVTRFVASRQYDSSKLEEVVGFKPEYDLQKTLEDAYKWLQEAKLV